MTDLFERVVVPVASPEDARASGRALDLHLDPGDSVVAVHVIEKAGGAPDKAGVEQREEYATDVFDALRDSLGSDRRIETDLRFATDVTDAIFEAAAEHDASAVVITPRGGSRWLRLLTGDVALDIVTETDRPVVVLPDVESGTGGDGDGGEDGDAHADGDGAEQ
jgi:nucleotide-binding universal stress UspA family protein